MTTTVKDHSRSAPDVEKRRPVRFINYPGDVTAGFNSLEPMGPTDDPNTLPTMNRGTELLWPVTSEYDADADRTRVGLSYVAPGQATP